MPSDVTCNSCEMQFPIPEGAERWFTCPRCGYQSAKQTDLIREDFPGKFPMRLGADRAGDGHAKGCLGMVVGAVIGFAVSWLFVNSGVGFGHGIGPTGFVGIYLLVYALAGGTAVGSILGSLFTVRIKK